MWALALLLTGLHICASTAKIDAATLRRTKLAAYDDQYTVNSVCECKQRCSVQEACLAASYKSPSTCWVFTGGTGGELKLQQDDEFITWFKNGEMALTTEVTTAPTTTTTPSTTPTPTPTTTPTTTPTATPTTTVPSTTVPPAPLFFKSQNVINTPTLEVMKTQCAASGGVPGSILTEHEYAWIKASTLFSDMGYNRMIVPAFAEGGAYVWYEGTDVLSTGVFQEGDNFINDPFGAGAGPLVVMDPSFNLVKTQHYDKWSWYNVLCKHV